MLTVGHPPATPGATPTAGATELRGRVVAISAGDGHTCALLDDGTASCWGWNQDGQLGDGTTTDSSTPVSVAGLANARAISSGSDHTCALLDDATARCWGSNELGELGDGTTTPSATLVPVGGLMNVWAISAGWSHTCALLADGTVRCWGSNELGQLGDGTTTASSTPVPVAGLVNVRAISAGGGHNCALLRDGTGRCWGFDIFGQLGDGTTTNSATPVPVASLANAAGISAGGDHTCALLNDGTARCWGWYGDGQLGGGTTTESSTPVPVTGLSNVRAISAGGGHNCAVLGDGTARCWGWNRYGQLGDGTTTDSSIPVAVRGLGEAAPEPGDAGPTPTPPPVTPGPTAEEARLVDLLPTTLTLDDGSIAQLARADLSLRGDPSCSNCGTGQPLADLLGVDIDNLEGALGCLPPSRDGPFDKCPFTGSQTVVGAIRAPGVDTARLLDAYLAWRAPSNTDCAWDSLELEGRSVRRMASDGCAIREYAYASGDVVFAFGFFGSDSIDRDILRQLPEASQTSPQPPGPTLISGWSLEPLASVARGASDSPPGFHRLLVMFRATNVSQDWTDITPPLSAQAISERGDSYGLGGGAGYVGLANVAPYLGNPEYTQTMPVPVGTVVPVRFSFDVPDAFPIVSISVRGDSDKLFPLPPEGNGAVRIALPGPTAALGDPVVIADGVSVSISNVRVGCHQYGAAWALGFDVAGHNDTGYAVTSELTGWAVATNDGRIFSHYDEPGGDGSSPSLSIPPGGDDRGTALVDLQQGDLSGPCDGSYGVTGGPWLLEVTFETGDSIVYDIGRPEVDLREILGP